jgi:hypothetical protein
LVGTVVEERHPYSVREGELGIDGCPFGLERALWAPVQITALGLLIAVTLRFWRLGQYSPLRQSEVSREAGLLRLSGQVV